MGLSREARQARKQREVAYKQQRARTSRLRSALRSCRNRGVIYADPYDRDFQKAGPSWYDPATNKFTAQVRVVDGTDVPSWAVVDHIPLTAIDVPGDLSQKDMCAVIMVTSKFLA